MSSSPTTSRRKNGAGSDSTGAKTHLNKPKVIMWKEKLGDRVHTEKRDVLQHKKGKSFAPTTPNLYRGKKQGDMVHAKRSTNSKFKKLYPNKKL